MHIKHNTQHKRWLTVIWALMLIVLLSTVVTLASQPAHAARSVSGVVNTYTPALTAIEQAQLAVPVVQTYFVPLPEDDLFTSFQTIDNDNDVSGDVQTRISIVISTGGTILYYDHWEDGFEADITNPLQTTTEIWGDGNASNGAAPGYPGDVFSAGDVIILANLVDPGDTTPIDFDGKDKIGASFPIAVSRYAFPQNPGSLLAGATEVLDADSWGTSFVAPAGQNSSDLTGTNPHQYVALYIMASQNNTSVTLTGRADTGPTSLTLNEGENAVVRVNQGATVTTDKPVQVHMVTGDIDSTWEMRWYSLTPLANWSSDYFSPTFTPDDDPNEDDSVQVWLYNPNGSAITVQYENANGLQTPISVPAGGIALSPVIPDESGARFYTTDGAVFFAYTIVDTDGSGQIKDWGHPLVPADEASSRAIVGLGYGVNPDESGCSSNRSVVWVTPIEVGTTATIRVYYDGSNDGPSDEDATFSVNYLESVRITDPDLDMTGALITATDTSGNPVNIVVAWGQDPTKSFSGDDCALDLGTVVPPLPEVETNKAAVLIDNDGDGRFGPGDGIRYEIRITNQGAAFDNAWTIKDEIPANTTYVEDTTEYKVNDGTAVSIPDDVSGTAFPLDCDPSCPYDGLGNIGVIPGGGSVTISFEVTIDDDVSICGETITNIADLEPFDDASVDTDVVCTDYGDAPDFNGQTLRPNGALHVIDPNGPYLGTVRPDVENDGQPTVGADGDDNNPAAGPDDEDGFIGFPDNQFGDGNGGQVELQVSGVGSAGVCVYGWIDWDDDGFSNDGTLDSFATAFASADGNVVLTFNSGLPDSGSYPDSAYMRFRMVPGECETTIEPTGVQIGGEVEDYVFAFSPTALNLTSLAADGRNINLAWISVSLLALLGMTLFTVWRRRREGTSL